jgi:hypothetical protein
LEGLPASVTEFDFAVGGPPEQVLVAVARREGLGFQRYSPGGALVEDQEDPALELVRLAGANDQSVSFFPRVLHVDSTVAGEGVGSRFLVGWRSASPSRNALRIATFQLEPSLSLSDRLFIEERNAVGISSFDFFGDSGGIVAAWRATSGQVSEVRTARADYSLDGLEREASVVSPSVRVAGAPAAVGYRGLEATAFTTTGDGARNLVAVVTTESGAVLGDISLVQDRAASTFDVRDLAWIPSRDMVSAVWSTAGADGDVLHLAHVRKSVFESLTTAVATPVTPVNVGTAFSGKGHVRGAQDGDGLALAWLGDGPEGRDIWVQRFGPDGAARSLAFAVTDGLADSVAEIEMASTSDGIALTWLVPGGTGTGQSPGDELVYRRFVCGN